MAVLLFCLYHSFYTRKQSADRSRKMLNMSPTSSQVMAKLNLQPNAEGGFYAETFRDFSVNLTSSQLPPRYKVSRPISTVIYFLLLTGSVSHLHRLPSAETWHFYMGEPLTILEMYEKNGSVKLTTIGQDFGENQRLQYTVPPDVWFGAFPTRDYNVSMVDFDYYSVVKNAPRDAEKCFSLVGTTVAPAFEVEDFVLANRSELVSSFRGHESLLSMITPSG